jgi:IMP dehydrogenase
MMEIAIRDALAFDDVLLEPGYSETLPDAVDPSGRFSRNISLKIPLVSAAMDTVTEHAMAIAIAQAGGIGVIHKNMTIHDQAEEIRRVKRYESGMVVNPVTIHPTDTLGAVRNLMDMHNISGIPVVESGTGKLVGIITSRDVRFATDSSTKVSELMTRDPIAVQGHVSREEAQELLHKHRIEKLMVVDDANRCVGLITVKDIEKAQTNPLGNKDSQGRLRVAAAIGVGQDGLRRAEQLIAAGVDVLVIDTAHGHSLGVIETVLAVKERHPHIDVVAGNVATPTAAEALIGAGADGIKIGIGPGSICTTRIVAGIGVPQLSAVMETSQACAEADVPAIADGGIRSSGDIVKALAAGADSVMLGSMLAGTDETPGETFLYQGRSYKGYRGMGSLGAMAQGSADRYGQAGVKLNKLVPEGVEAKVPARGPIGLVLHQLVGGLRSGMGYVGAPNLAELQRKATFRRITNAGLRESHVHDVHVTKSAPNYSQE